MTHDGFKNMYSFVKEGKTIKLAPLTPSQVYEDQLKLKSEVVQKRKSENESDKKRKRENESDKKRKSEKESREVAESKEKRVVPREKKERESAKKK